MTSTNDPEMRRHHTTAKDLIRKNVLNTEFAVRVIIPVILFAAFNHFNMALTAVISAGTWSIAVVAIQFMRSKKVNIFAAITAGISAIGLIGAIISKNPKFYLASPIVTDIILALIFLGSVLLGKPLIQVFAEHTAEGAFPDELRRQPKYKSAWTILTVAWGILSVTQALLRIILLYSVSSTLYFSISTVYGNISTPLMLVASFLFPGWYWRRNFKGVLK